MRYRCEAILKKGSRAGEICGHEWVIRTDRGPKKCPMCQSFSGFGPVEKIRSPGNDTLLAGATAEETLLLAGVLSLLRTGDRIYADGIRQAVARHEAEQKRAGRSAPRKAGVK